MAQADIIQQLDRVRIDNLVKQHKAVYVKLSQYCTELTGMTLVEYLEVTDTLLQEAEGA